MGQGRLTIQADILFLNKYLLTINKKIEFLAATMEKSLYMKEEKLHMAFKMLDLDGNGKISKDELKAVLGSFYSYIFLQFNKININLFR